jgi:hypothetical protein
MIRFRMRLWLALAVAVAALTAQPHAQSLEIHLDEWNSPAVRIGQNFELKADQAVRQALVIGGDAIIEGHVDRDVVVILGKAQLASTAVIDGSFVVIGGTASVTEGAKVSRDLLVVGGIDAPSGFNPGGEHVVVGTAGLGRSLSGIVPWLTNGLLLGRPIVPSLPWVWAVAGVFFLINLLFNTVFDAPVRATAVTLRTTPFSAFVTGLLVLLLIGPICVLLAVSVIGIAVIPFVLCAMLLGAIFGRIGVVRWLGTSVSGEEEPGNRLHALRSFVIGSAIVCVAYMIPILGFVTWIIVGLLGLGAATLAFFAAYRRENPKRPKPVRVPEPPPIPPSSPAPVAVAPPIAFAATPPPAAYDAVPPIAAFDDAAVPPHASAPPAAALAATGLLRPRLHRGDDPRAGARRQLAQRRCRDAPGADHRRRVPRRVLDLARHHARGDHLPAARGPHRRLGTEVSRSAGPRRDRHLLARRPRPRVPLDPPRSRAAGVARPRRRHLRRKSAAQLAGVARRVGARVLEVQGC